MKTLYIRIWYACALYRVFSFILQYFDLPLSSTYWKRWYPQYTVLVLIDGHFTDSHNFFTYNYLSLKKKWQSSTKKWSSSWKPLGETIPTTKVRLEFLYHYQIENGRKRSECQLYNFIRVNQQFEKSGSVLLTPKNVTWQNGRQKLWKSS